MIRTFITPQKQNISIDLPESFINQRVGIVAFKLDDELSMSESLINSKRVTDLFKELLSEEEDKAWQTL
jgi:hypothetical protein